MRGALVFTVAALLAAGCGQAPPSAPSAPSAPTAPSAPPGTGVPPKAVLSLGADDLNPPLAVTNYDMLFDGSRSTGDGLTYLLDFGDGTSSTQVAALHASPVSMRRTARLTVTDRFGRTDSVTRDYFLANLDNSGCCSTSWAHTLISTYDNVVALRLTLRQDGAALSGTYRGEDRVFRQVTGTLRGDRSVFLRTDDGSIELTGAVEWKEPGRENFSQAGVTLRLTVRGGPLNGKVFDFSYHDPF
jgi:hypothetical protein